MQNIHHCGYGTRPVQAPSPLLPKEQIGLPTGQETLTALRTREGRGGGEGEEKGRHGGGGNF